MYNKDVMSINIVSCCAHNAKKSILNNSIAQLNLDFRYFRYLQFSHNNKSIAANYASIKLDKYEDDDIFVFVHDDVIINCADFTKRIESGLQNYDVVGVAGICEAKIDSPALWHLMKPYPNAPVLRGCVAHPVVNKVLTESQNQFYYTSFGPIPAQVILADGVLLATTKRVLQKVNFDDTNPARYHFYDLDFTLNCSINKLKVGVCDIPIIHMSHGLEEREGEWEEGASWFLNKYKQYIGQTLSV